MRIKLQALNDDWKRYLANMIKYVRINMIEYKNEPFGLCQISPSLLSFQKL